VLPLAGLLARPPPFSKGDLIMLTAEDLIAAYHRLAPKQPPHNGPKRIPWRERLKRAYRYERRRARRAVFRQYGLDAWANLKLPCYREARADLARRWRGLAAYYAESSTKLAAQETELAAQEFAIAQHWARLCQKAEARGVLAKLGLTHADLDRCQTLDALMDLVETAMDRALADLDGNN
jgi:hypothetical protein